MSELNAPRATVIANSDDRVWLRAESLGCARCRSGVGCGAGIFSSTSRHARFSIDLSATAADGAGRQLRSGQDVTVSLPNGRLLQAALLAYGMPLLGVLAGAWLGGLASTNNNDQPAIVLAGVGLFAGFIVGRLGARRLPSDLQLKLVAAADAPIGTGATAE